MRCFVVIMLLCAGVTGCGKKPNTLTPIAAPTGQSQLVQPYPMIQPAPPASR